MSDRGLCGACSVPIEHGEATRQRKDGVTVHYNCHVAVPRATTSSGRLADLQACVEGTYSAEDLAAVLFAVAHAEAENGMLPTVSTQTYLDGVLGLANGTGVIDALCDYCDERHAGPCEDAMRTGAGGDPEPIPRGVVTLTYTRDPRIYVEVNLDDKCVESAWSHDPDTITPPKAESASELGGGLTLDDFNEAVAIAESDCWPSWH
jgi:hypothetical protein